MIISEITSSSLQPEKILPILWEEVDHMVVFDFSEICQTYKSLDITKRNTITILAMFYDPTDLLQTILINLKRLFPERVVRKCSVKMACLKISQNSHENTRGRVFFK